MTTKKEKLIREGVKKIFGLTRTKIRLAEEANTISVKPEPLPLIKLLSGKKIYLVKEAKTYCQHLKENLNLEDKKQLASLVLQLTAIIEGVKYKFEPPEALFFLSEKKLRGLEAKAKKENSSLNLLLMTEKTYPGINLFIGRGSPSEAVKIGEVPSVIAPLLSFLFQNDYFSQKLKLQNVTSILGRRTLINTTIHFSLGEFGAKLREETK